MRGRERDAICGFKPTDMQDLDPDSWEEFLRQVILTAIPSRCFKYVNLNLRDTLNSYKDHASYLLDLDMIYIPEIRFYHGKPKCNSDHEYFIADVKTSLAQESEDTVYTLFRREMDSNELHCHSGGSWKEYLPWLFRTPKKVPEAECRRIKEMDLEDELIGRISFPPPKGHNASSESAIHALDQSLCFHELLLTASAVIDSHKNQWLCCHLFTAYTFRSLCQLKAIPMTKEITCPPREARASAAYTDKMRRKDELKRVAEQMTQM